MSEFVGSGHLCRGLACKMLGSLRPRSLQGSALSLDDYKLMTMLDHSYQMISRRSVLATLGVSAVSAAALCSRTNTTSKTKTKSTAAYPAPPREVNGCVIDEERLSPVKLCTVCCGPEEPRDDWNHSCLHPATAAYSCGRLYSPGQPNRHDHDPAEIDLCRRFSNEAAQLIAGAEVCESEAFDVALEPFFIASNRGDSFDKTLTEAIIRVAFNGTIYPQAKITIFPLKDEGRGWEAIAMCVDSPENEPKLPTELDVRQWEAHEQARKKREQLAHKWRTLLAWFRLQPEFVDMGFVIVGEEQMSDTNYGCVFPRLVVATTTSGSLVGVAGYAVIT